MPAHFPVRSVAAPILALATLLLTGCARSLADSGPATPPPPEIPVVTALRQTQPDALGFTGRIEALDRAVVRPRVGGMIEAVHFREGSQVRAGDALFSLDARPYRARRDQAAAEVARAEAALQFATQDLARARRLHEATAISAEELERRDTALATARAALAGARASLATAELELGFTQVRAPFDGRVGRAELTPGNLVQADQTVLTRLVSTGAMRVRFALDEATLHRLRAAAASAQPGVSLTLPGTSRAYAGTVDYVAQVVDPASGTAEVRATLDGTDGLLLDGMFARVELLLPPLARSVLVPETALGAEQGVRYVLVAGNGGKLEQRPVELGARIGTQRVVTAGLQPGEAIVTGGLQFLRAGMVIKPLVAPAPAAANVALHRR